MKPEPRASHTIHRLDHDGGGAFVIYDGDSPRAPYLGEITWTWRDRVMVIHHTGVRPALRGHGVARKLVQAAIDAARAEGFTIQPVCSYVREVFDREPALADLRA